MTRLRRIRDGLRDIESYDVRGQVCSCLGSIIRARIPGVSLGDLCEIRGSGGAIECEVIGFDQDTVALMSYDSSSGVAAGDEVRTASRKPKAWVGPALLGRVIDSFSRPLDDQGTLQGLVERSLDFSPINPLQRREISTAVATGTRSIDAFLTLGQGQRIGLFAGSGVGKSTLLTDIRNHTAQMDAINVVVLIGERGREVEEFVRSLHGSRAAARTVVVVETAEQSSLRRVRALYSAISIAEYFSEEGEDVLLTIDSMTRFSLALREIGLSVGEPITFRGFTSSVFAKVPKVVERCGSFKDRGSITGIFSVLVEGDDFSDPVVDNLKAILDGHIVLSRELARKGVFPAVDVLRSVSRLFQSVASESQRQDAERVRSFMAEFEENRELYQLARLDSQDSGKAEQHLELNRKVEAFLKQKVGQPCDMDACCEQLHDLRKQLDEA